MSSSRIKIYVPLAQRFSAQVVSFHSAVAAKLGLHVTDLKAVRLLAKEAMSPSHLGAQMGLSGAAATALIDRLEKAGHAVRQRDTDDHRRVLVCTVPEKLCQVERLYKGQHASMSKLLSKYTADSFSVIADFLEQGTKVLAHETENLKLIRKKRSRRK